jgi:hypothetical protein
MELTFRQIIFKTLKLCIGENIQERFVFKIDA